MAVVKEGRLGFWWDVGVTMRVVTTVGITRLLGPTAGFGDTDEGRSVVWLVWETSQTSGRRVLYGYFLTSKILQH
ncbi:hypothetical protein Hamer_G004616 [Homarus americanus]|uniref:Uncharacterized protein n=1 Tax=Homarus americanus TaxID=6706 RepID=A0A8J5JY24_HOMAM|nr:hypothetical protein Hamer_G004616 [Homarus americanus]